MKIARFKDYNNNTIIIDPHKHSISDTINDKGSTAIVTTSTDGFMSKTDKTTLIDINTRVNTAKSKIQSMIYLYPSITLITGSEFLTALTTVGPNAVNVIFTKTAVPADKKATARVVSTTNSEAKSYMYLNGTTVYVCPENSNFTTYLNEDCNNMFNGCNNLTSIDFSGINSSKISKANAMFKNCAKLTSSITIHTPYINYFTEIFTGCSTASGSKFSVNYKSAARQIVNYMLSTKSSNSNVVLGTLVV